MAKDFEDYIRLGYGRHVPLPRGARKHEASDAKSSPPSSVRFERPRAALPLREATSRTLGISGRRPRIVIAGLGAVGSFISLTLAQMGCDETLIDFDRVEPTNLEAGRSVYLPETLGMPKTTAMEHIIRRAGLRVDITTMQRRVEDFTNQEIRSLAADTDAFVAAIDDVAQLLRMNPLLYNECPVVAPAFHHGGRSGHLVWTVRRLTPCWACSIGATSPDQLHTLHAEPAFPPDIRRIADLAVRTVQWLCADEGEEAAHFLDPARNILFVDNRPSGSAERALAVHLMAADRNPDCPVCGQFGGDGRR